MIQAKEIKLVPLADIKLNPKNRNQHPKAQIDRLVEILKYQGFRRPGTVSNQTGYLVCGEGRYLAAKILGLKAMPVMYQDYASPEQEYADGIADNAVDKWAEIDMELLKTDLVPFSAGFNMDLLGIKDFVLDLSIPEDSEPNASMRDTFLVPPFSVLDARQGYWKERKAHWIARGIKSEVGRAENLLKYSAAMNSAQAGVRPYENRSHSEAYKGGDAWAAEGTSIFDPVLCELAYRWFSAPGANILDPFAGGSVRGVVASLLGRQYCGVDLRPEQVDANREQAEDICKDIMPAWYHGDSAEIDIICAGYEADMILSCPPYADLEVYSDDPRDISNMPYKKFLQIYQQIIFKSCKMLKNDRFAVWVVGEVRDKKSGVYRNFVGDTIQAFLGAGLSYYNEAILVTSVGSLPLRAGRTMQSTRKLGKTHQNVLVFVKGDGKKAAANCGAIDFNVQDEGDAS